MKVYNKYLFLIIAALIISITSVSSQDLVVITNNDSINCKIIQLKNNRLTFAVYKDDETIEVSYPEESIETFQKDFYKKNDIPDIDLYNLMKEKPKAYLLIGGGYSQFIKSSYYINYYDNLNRGFYINLDLGLFLNYGLGFGLKYEFFRSEGYGLKSYTYNGWNSPTTIKGDRVLVLNFIAPSILLKLPVKTNNDNFILNLSPGYLHYSSYFKESGGRSNTDSFFGVELGVGYHIHLSEKLNLALLLSGIVNFGTNNLSRFNAGIALGIK